MKSFSNVYPQTKIQWNNHQSAINYDVTEHTVERETGTETEYEFTTVIVPLVPTYSDIVESMIREKYTACEEFAILRQRDSKPESFSEYNTYAESCKTKAREIISII